MTLAEAHLAHAEGVQHADEAESPVWPAAAGPRASCARCGGLIAAGPTGRPRRGARYCAPGCRLAATRERRALARAALLEALADLRHAIERAEVGLRAMGFNPSHPRPKKSTAVGLGRRGS